MNDELDVMGRLVDYHDHIAAQPVLVADDLHRGRRRVRRNRGLVASAVALGLASVVAAASLVTGGDPAEQNPDNPGLNAPLVAPKSILELRELGFHVKGLPAVGGSLMPDHQGIEVAVANATFAVEVYYQGKGPGLLGSDRPRQKVSIHGIAGTFVERVENNSYLAYLIWEYAPDSWATVWRSDDADTPSRKAQILTIAKAIRPGGAPVRLPFRVGTASAPLLRAETVVEVNMSRDTEYWRASFESGLGIMGNTADSGSSCDPPRAFTYRGYSGCLQGTDNDQSQVGGVVLQVDGTDRIIHNQGLPLTGYRIEDLKQLLAEITVAPSEDRSTWFDLTTALGG